MSERKKQFLWTGLSALLVVLLLLPAAALAQDDVDDDDDDEGVIVCNPAMMRLAEAMVQGGALDENDACDDLIRLRGEGAGLGEIMKAWVLSQSLQVDWDELLEQKQEGVGWGQIKAAHRFAGGDPEVAQELFELKQSGLGWGQIMKAQALVSSGLVPDLDLEGALGMVGGETGVGWGQIRQQFDLPPGPPPWAGGGKNKAKGVAPGRANQGDD